MASLKFLEHPRTSAAKAVTKFENASQARRYKTFEYFTILHISSPSWRRYAFLSLHSRECDVFLRESHVHPAPPREFLTDTFFEIYESYETRKRLILTDWERERETSVVEGIRRSNYSRIPRVQFLLDIPTTPELTKNRRGLFTRVRRTKEIGEIRFL